MVRKDDFGTISISSNKGGLWSGKDPELYLHCNSGGADTPDTVDTRHTIRRLQRGALRRLRWRLFLCSIGGRLLALDARGGSSGTNVDARGEPRRWCRIRVVDSWVIDIRYLQLCERNSRSCGVHGSCLNTTPDCEHRPRTRSFRTEAF